MIYDKLGNTGIKVSRLGFGAMRLPMLGEGKEAAIDRSVAIPMIHKAFESGVNYIDSAVGYCNRDSQKVVGEALKGWRDRIVVSTKNHDYGTDERKWFSNLEDSLRLLGIGCIDVYHHHGINWAKWTDAVRPRISGWMRKAKKNGMIRHIAVSYHDSPENLPKIIRTGYPEVITLQYNLLDRKLEEGIALAHEKGIGIVVMGPVGGGRLGVSSGVLENLLPGIARVPELALRFVLSNKNVSSALSGMSTMRQVLENVRTASEKTRLAKRDLMAIDEHMNHLRKLADLYCTGCNYCLPCPADVAIPKIFERYNRGRVYGLWENARNAYADIGVIPWDKGNKADKCSDCGACEKKCPQHIRIREQLREAHRALSKQQ